MDIITGFITQFIYQNDENGFAIAKLKTQDHKSVIITGNIAVLEVGNFIEATYIEKNDPKYGTQFQIQTFQAQAPNDVDSLIAYLSSSQIQGIGPVFAERIVKKFGMNTLEIIENTPEQLLEVEGVGHKKYNAILSSWVEQKKIRDLIFYLQNKNIPSHYATPIFKKWSDASIATLENNPYLLIWEIEGFGFLKADQLALQMGCSESSIDRFEAATAHILQLQLSKGSTILLFQVYLKELFLLTKIECTKESIFYEKLLNSQKFELILSDSGEMYLALHYVLKIEKSIKKILTDYIAYPVQNKVEFQSIQHNLPAFLSHHQRTAIEGILKNRFAILTGGPGTGKSTITKVIVDIFQKSKLKVLLTAPTGKAAKRLEEITGEKAYTIHSAFEINRFASSNHSPALTEKLVYDLIVIDEMSMIDTFVFYSILNRLSFHTQLLILGDVDQLPSIGPGKILNDLILSKTAAVFHLYEIFRQAAESKIILSTYEVISGNLPLLKIEKDSDFFFLKDSEQESILNTMNDLLGERLKNKYNIDPLIDVQILCPMHKGILGTQNVNQSIQKLLNPKQEGKQEYLRGNQIFRIGDKVIQQKNNYEKGVFNGDIGFVVNISTEDQTLEIRFDQLSVTYNSKELIEIELAYAITVHKFQGSENQVIIIPIHSSQQQLLHRNLLYTAMSRAKKLLIMLGQVDAFEKAIQRIDQNQRLSALSFLFKEKNELFPEIIILPELGSADYQQRMKAIIS